MTADWGVRSLPPDLAQRYVAEGFWRDESLGQLLAGAIADHPDLTVKIRSAVRPWTGTEGQVLDAARRLAGAVEGPWRRRR